MAGPVNSEDEYRCADRGAKREGLGCLAMLAGAIALAVVAGWWLR